jgi:hypothetical protein
MNSDLGIFCQNRRRERAAKKSSTDYTGFAEKEKAGRRTFGRVAWLVGDNNRVLATRWVSISWRIALAFL